MNPHDVKNAVNAVTGRALRKAEWGAVNGGGWMCCPVCGRPKTTGHTDDCELALALKAFPAPIEPFPHDFRLKVAGESVAELVSGSEEAKGESKQVVRVRMHGYAAKNAQIIAWRLNMWSLLIDALKEIRDFPTSNSSNLAPHRIAKDALRCVERKFERGEAS